MPRIPIHLRRHLPPGPLSSVRLNGAHIMRDANDRDMAAIPVDDGDEQRADATVAQMKLLWPAPPGAVLHVVRSTLTAWIAAALGSTSVRTRPGVMERNKREFV